MLLMIKLLCIHYMVHMTLTWQDYSVAKLSTSNDWNIRLSSLMTHFPSSLISHAELITHLHKFVFYFFTSGWEQHTACEKHISIQHNELKNMNQYIWSTNGWQQYYINVLHHDLLCLHCFAEIFRFSYFTESLKNHFFWSFDLYIVCVFVKRKCSFESTRPPYWSHEQWQQFPVYI